MKHLRCISPLNLAFGDEDMPVVDAGEVLARIRRVGICGTDLHAVDGTQPYFSYPRILGHELAVEIETASPDSGLRSGEFATVVPYFNCGNCHMCVSGRPNACVSLRVFGVHIDGGMREFISVPHRYLIKSGQLSLDQLALIEPLAVGAHAVRRADVRNGDQVLVIGAGPIGMATMFFAGLKGAGVIALEMNPWRLGFCSSYPWITAIEGNPSSAKDQIAKLTDGKMPAVIFDATGNLNAIQSAFPLMSHGGKYVLVGLQKDSISFSHPEFHKREGTLMSSRNATHDDFQLVIDSIVAGKIDPLRLVTQRIHFDQSIDGFKQLLAPGSKAIKALIEF